MRNYYNFRAFGKRVLITNDFGRYLWLTREEFILFTEDRYRENKELTERLEKGLFVSELSPEAFADQVAGAMADSRNYLFQGTGLHILSQFHAPQQILIAGIGKILEKVAVVFPNVLHRHPGVEVGLGGHIGHVPAAVDVHRHIQETHFAAGGLDQPGRHFHPGGFAAAVGAQHGVHMPLFQLQADMIHGGFGAEQFGYRFAFQHINHPPPTSFEWLRPGRRPGCAGFGGTGAPPDGP